MSIVTVDSLLAAIDKLKADNSITGNSKVYISCYETIMFEGTKVAIDCNTTSLTELIYTYK